MPAPAPTASLQLGTQSQGACDVVKAGGKQVRPNAVRIYWSSTNATSCTIVMSNTKILDSVFMSGLGPNGNMVVCSLDLVVNGQLAKTTSPYPRFQGPARIDCVGPGGSVSASGISTGAL
jgi:hypothetical protein